MNDNQQINDDYIVSLFFTSKTNPNRIRQTTSYIIDNIDDIEKLNKWKQKNTKFYNNAIDVWTKRDQLKIKTAKDNNLNYKAFYSLDELKQYLEI